VVFSPKKGWVDRKVDLPCGQCIGCRIQRSRQWAARCVHEASMHEANCFITLTHRELPPERVDKKTGEIIPVGSVDVRVWQLFAKALRRKIGRFRFFMCGEYGDENHRPHYHALIFGHDFRADRVVYKHKPHRLWTSETLTKTWGHGHAIIGSLTYETAAYCARYCMKKVNGPDAETHYQRTRPDTGERYNVRPEFVTMSRRPGIGAPWLEAFKSDVYPSDQVVIGGKTFRPPRFYDNNLPEGELEALKKKRRRAVQQRSTELTPDRLDTREKVLKSTLQTLKRDL